MEQEYIWIGLGDEEGLISQEERVIIVMAAVDFFEKYTAVDPVICKLSSLHAAMYQLNMHNKDKLYEPKDVFEVIYQEFGDSLFSQYTADPRMKPSRDQMHAPERPGLLPITHYFAKSSALWEYAVHQFDLDPMAVDGNGSTALIDTIKRGELAAAVSIIRNITDEVQRFKLVQHTNVYGDNALQMICINNNQERPQYYELLQLLQEYSG